MGVWRSLAVNTWQGHVSDIGCHVFSEHLAGRWVVYGNKDETDDTP